MLPRLLVACALSAGASHAAAPGLAASESQPPQVLPREERDGMLARMAVLVSSHIARRDTDHAVFHGCVDWHSAAHGHWALLRIARATGRHGDLAAEVDRRLSPEGLAAEARLLRENPDFEMPYGRAWFLRLAVEYEAWSREALGADPERLRAMADEAAESLLAFYREYPPTPFSHNYANASWALAQLHAYLTLRGDERRLGAVQRMIEDRFLNVPGVMGFDSDAGAPEFFSPFGNWGYLVAKTQDAAVLGRFLEKRPVLNPSLKPVLKLLPYPHSPSKKYRVFAHHLGMNWSRAWALRALSLKVPSEADRERMARAHREHARAAMKDHERYWADYGAYGHWVPQFAVYALTEGDVE